MLVKLVNCVFDKKRMSEPMGICYIASVLRENGILVEVVEPRLKGYNVEDTVKELLKEDFDILGLSVFTFQKENVSLLVSLMRERGFTGKIVMGGLGPSLCSELYFKQCPGVDLIIKGEGEYSFLELAQVLEKEMLGQFPEGTWKEIKGVCYVDMTGEIISNKSRERIKDLDTLPFMARDVLEENIKKYGKDMIFAPILGGRGCYGRCSYCWLSAALDLQEGVRYRLRSVKSIIDEIEVIVKKYGVTHFSFEDDNFIPPGKKGIERAIEFRDEIKKRKLNIQFFFQTRPDTISREAIQCYKESGLKSMFIGIEAIENEDIDIYNKGITSNNSGYNEQKIENVLTLLDELGYSPDVSRENVGRLRFGYIAFHSLTTLKSVRKSLEFFRKHNLTPKRLMVKVNFFEGDMDIKKNFLERGYLAEDNVKYPFKYPRVALVYDSFIAYSNYNLKYREQIRSIEKHTFRRGIGKENFIELVKVRSTLDNMMMDFLDSVLSIAEDENITGEKVKECITFTLNEEKEKLRDYIKKNNIQKKIDAACEKYNVEKDMSDLYW